MVGAPALRAAARSCGALFVLAAGIAAGQDLVATGACRDGEPNGGYTLRSNDGRLRVVGAFAKGRRTGTFVFWAERGARIAIIPYDNERKTGTLAIWYAPASGSDGGRKSEAAYVDDMLHGEKRSWHPNGNPRTVLRYERGELVSARAWIDSGAPLPEAEAREIAARDLVTDEQFYATLEALVADHRPACE